MGLRKGGRGEVETKEEKTGKIKVERVQNEGGRNTDQDKK